MEMVLVVPLAVMEGLEPALTLLMAVQLAQDKMLVELIIMQAAVVVSVTQLLV